MVAYGYDIWPSGVDIGPEPSRKSGEFAQQHVKMSSMIMIDELIRLCASKGERAGNSVAGILELRKH